MLHRKTYLKQKKEKNVKKIIGGKNANNIEAGKTKWITMKSVPYCTETNYTFNKTKNEGRSAASDKLLAIEHGQSHEMLFKYCHCHISLYNNTTYIHTYI